MAALSEFAIVGLLACAFTGFFVSMLWPGNIVIASDRFSSGGVLVFALMAAGGDLGCSIGPQLVGSLTDCVIASNGMIEFAQSLGMSLEQLGMRIGLLAGAGFALLGIVVGYFLLKAKKKEITE